MRSLPLEDQFDYTNGGCSIFAIAAQRRFGGQLVMLWCADARQFARHDWPEDVPLCLHVFVRGRDGSAIDAEGCRPVQELLKAFGVRRGWTYRLEDVDAATVADHFRMKGNPEHHFAEVLDLLDQHEWIDQVPAADGELARSWKLAGQRSQQRLNSKEYKMRYRLVEYVSVWDGGHEVTSPATLDTKTGSLLDITAADEEEAEAVQTLDREFVRVLGVGDFEVTRLNPGRYALSDVDAWKAALARSSAEHESSIDPGM